VLGPTNPNRLYLMSGMVDAAGKYEGPVIDNAETPPYTWTTYPERLEQAGVSWKIYQSPDNFDDNALAWFAQFQQAPTSSPLYQKGMAVSGLQAFIDDIRSDSLPSVSWLVGPTLYSEHPGGGAPARGCYLTDRFLRALADNPRVWRKTAFILNYDENGGFFDHVLPPLPPAGTADEFVNGLPIGLGIRVPMLMISPWSRGGEVVSDTFDHTSVIRLLEQRFGVEEPNISAWRRQTVGDLTSCFDFEDGGHGFPHLPDVRRDLLQQLDSEALKLIPAPPEPQRAPEQEARGR